MYPPFYISVKNLTVSLKQSCKIKKKGLENDNKHIKYDGRN